MEEWIYYHVHDHSGGRDRLIFRTISNGDINSKIYWNDKWWELKDLISHFTDLKYKIFTESFTLDDLGYWLINRNDVD